MKILKPKEELKIWSQEYECSGFKGCGAKLLIEFGDLYSCISHNCKRRVYAFICPECGLKHEFSPGSPNGNIYIDRYVYHHSSQIPKEKDHPYWNQEENKIIYPKNPKDILE